MRIVPKNKNIPKQYWKDKNLTMVHAMNNSDITDSGFILDTPNGRRYLRLDELEAVIYSNDEVETARKIKIVAPNIKLIPETPRDGSPG